MSDRLFSRPWWRALGFRLFGLLMRPHANQWAPLPRHPRRILVLLPVLRGDYIVASPLLEALHKARPQAEIAVVVTRASYDLAIVDTSADRVILYEKLPSWPRSVFQILRYRPDIVLLPKGHPAFTETLMVLLSRAPFRVGLAHPNHNAILTHPIPHDWDNVHRTEAYARLLQPFGMDPTLVKRRLHVGVDPNAESWAEGVVGQQTGSPRIAINLSAGNSPSRHWPAENWRRLMELLSNSLPNCWFHLLASPADQPLAEELSYLNTRSSTHPTHTVLEAAALVARCDFLVTSETGIVHIAAARNVPMVVLYNGDHENYTRFEPQTVPNRSLLAPVGQSVKAHSSETVHEAVLALIDELGIQR